MPKPLRVAGEVDGWCTRCRLLLNHRIVSMKAGAPYQVECLTCRTTHLWRKSPPGEKADKGAASGARPRTAGLSGSGSSAAGGASRGRASASVTRHEQRWEQAIAGRGVLEFRAYNAGGNFREGELLRHKKFGDGVVTRVIDASKVEVLFKDEARTLAQGLR
ncbi:MAG: hypothetical protein ACRENE_11935 [Polyangiaceae bacterium]